MSHVAVQEWALSAFWLLPGHGIRSQETLARTRWTCVVLQRLVRKGQIPNAGRKGRPLIRISDLPRRAPTVESPQKATYDPALDAQDVLSRARRVG